MSSSQKAFAKLALWKKSQTALRLTVVTNSGVPDKHIGEIFSVDGKDLVIGFVVRSTHEHFAIDLSGATYLLGARALEARRGEDDFVAFEEL